MNEEDSLSELCDYTPWELIKIALKIIIQNVWRRLKHPKRRFLFSVDSLTPEEIERLKEEAISSVKAKAAEVLGGSPDDYVVK